MNFTRDPMIETIITPKDGFKLVLRNGRGEEFFVDSVQVILMGSSCFYRSLEKPKAFVVPAIEYEILEVRDTRMVMKLPNAEKGGIKIGGGREAAVTMTKPDEETAEKEVVEEQPLERRKEKKRFRRGRRDRVEKEEMEPSLEEGLKEEKPNFIIPPPSTLISETIARYKDIPGFASAFFEKGEEQVGEMAPVPTEEIVHEEEEKADFLFDDQD